jgi:signal transduction histidine kinase
MEPVPLSNDLSQIKALEAKIRELSQEEPAGPDHAAFQAQLNTHLLALVEQRARHAEALNRSLQEHISELKRRKERMVTTVHDLKVPVTISLLNLELAEAEKEPAVKEVYLNGVRRELEFLLETIANMLDLERPAGLRPALKRERLFLRELVAEVEARMRVLIKDKPSLELRNEVPPDLPPVHCDRHLMTRVLANLYSNAIKYTEIGSITVGGSASTAASTVRLFMRDTGAGIEPARKARLFQIFEGDSERYDSLGVGLVFVQNTVSAHGGRVWLESERGKGTCVNIELPLGPEVHWEDAGTKDL